MEKIKAFVQKTLGCGCPEEVFSYIDCRSNITSDNILLKNKINIGNRLLIFIVELHDPDPLKETLTLLVDTGKKERDRFGFNRFRLVLAVEKPNMVHKDAFDIFDTLEKDERVHLHVIHREEIKELRADSKEL
jgi:hypothetical protein